MTHAIRASLVTFDGDPLRDGAAARRYEADAIVVMDEGRPEEKEPGERIFEISRLRLGASSRRTRPERSIIRPHP